MHVSLGRPQKTLQVHAAASIDVKGNCTCPTNIEIERRTEENNTISVQIVLCNGSNIVLHRIDLPLRLGRDVPFLVHGGIEERIRGQQLLEVERAGDEINHDGQNGMHFHRGSPRFASRKAHCWFCEEARVALR